MSVDEINIDDNELERFNQYIESIEQFLKYDSDAHFLEDLIEKDTSFANGFDEFIDKIQLQSLKQECKDAVAAIVDYIQNLPDGAFENDVGIPLLQNGFKIIFDIFKATYDQFSNRFKASKSHYKHKHARANLVTDYLFSKQDNINIVNEVINIAEYTKLTTFDSLSQETRRFVENVLNWLQHGKYDFSSFGKSIVCKHAKNKRFRRELMLLFPFALGNQLNWNEEDTFEYFACGSAAQNEAMGITPAIATDLHYLASDRFIVSTSDIKLMLDVSISGDHETALKLAREMQWRSDGNGPILKSISFMFHCIL